MSGLRFYRFIIVWIGLGVHLTLASQNFKNEIDSIESLLTKDRNPSEIFMDRAALSLLYFKSQDYPKAETLYQTTLSKATSAHDQKALGLLYHNRAIMFYYQYAIDSAITYNKKALSHRKAVNDDVGTLKTISNLASLYYMTSDFKNSLTLFKEGLELESKLNYPEGKYIDINNMANAYSYMNYFDKALQLYRKSEMSPNLTDKKRYTIYSGLSSTYKQKGDLDSALFYAEKSKEFAILTGDSLNLAYAYSHLGLVYNNLNKQRESNAFFRSALEIAQRFDDKRLVMACNGNIAANYINLNLVDSADVYIKTLLKLNESLNIKLDGEDILKLLADYFYRTKDYKNSYEYFKIYSNYRDSIFNLEASAKLIELQERYESEKKEKENQVLLLENEGFKTSRNYMIAILLVFLLGLVLISIAYKKIVASRKVVSEQKDLLAEQQKEILDSIQYARRIQYALLASDNLLKKHLPEHFVLFRPKAVVSGDFYWAIPTVSGFIYITGDCTGHGVPGAFMSLLFITTLRQTITEYNIQRPDLILNKVREEIVKSLNPEGSTVESKDGMDAVVCLLDVENRKLIYAAANNSFYIIRKNALLTCKADKMPVGLGFEEQKPFTYNELQLEKGDMIYTFTDGFADQFGGPSGKKYKYKQFEELLLSIHQLEMPEQKARIETAFENWKGELEQVDDVCVIGTKIS